MLIMSFFGNEGIFGIKMIKINTAIIIISCHIRKILLYSSHFEPIHNRQIIFHNFTAIFYAISEYVKDENVHIEAFVWWSKLANSITLKTTIISFHSFVAGFTRLYVTICALPNNSSDVLWLTVTFFNCAYILNVPSANSYQQLFPVCNAWFASNMVHFHFWNEYQNLNINKWTN